MSDSLRSADELAVALVGATAVPPHFLERAASHARICAALTFSARMAAGSSSSAGGDAAFDAVEVTPEAAELIDDVLGRIVEDAVEHGGALARLRAATASAHAAAALPFPTTLAAARELAAADATASAAPPPVISPADVDVYLAEVWPGIVLPSADLAARGAPLLRREQLLPPPPPPPPQQAQQAQQTQHAAAAAVAAAAAPARKRQRT